METLIDTKNFNKVNAIDVRWYAHWKPDIESYYAVGTKHLKVENGKIKNQHIEMQRIIMDAQKGEVVDHKTHTTLDNRESNIRKVTGSQNSKNRKSKNKNNTSGYRNVSFDSKGRPIVQLQENGKNRVWRNFSSVEEAGRFAEVKRKELYGEFAGND
jgi:hypothetical protein